MNWIITIYIALLFFVLSPGVLLRIPRKGKPMVVAAVHAVVFALIWHFTGKMVWKASVSMGAGKTEGFREGVAQCGKKAGSKCDPQNDLITGSCAAKEGGAKIVCNKDTKVWTAV